MVLALVAISILVVALTVSAVSRSPKWLVQDERIRKNWTLLNIVSGIVSFITATGVSIAAFFLTPSNVTITTYGVCVAALVFVAVQSTVTDFALRMADRWTLRLSCVAVATMGVIELLSYGETNVLVWYGMLALMASATIFLPSFGASDGRALLLVVLAGVPTLGLIGMVAPIWGILGLIVLYGVILAVKQRSASVFFKKISTPMVPLIVIPYAIAISVFPIMYAMNNV